MYSCVTTAAQTELEFSAKLSAMNILYKLKYELIMMQIELYNTMLEKEGTEGEEEAKKAYKAARERSDHAAELAAGDKISSALIDRVRNLHSAAHSFFLFAVLSFLSYIYIY